MKRNGVPKEPFRLYKRFMEALRHNPPLDHNDVGEARDGERGLKAVGDGRSWDVVLLDQRIPGMDGL